MANRYKFFLCLFLVNAWSSNCEDITIWDDEDANQRQGSLTIRFMNDKGLLMTIMDALRGQKLLPMCSMVGCASNATQCVANGGKEMVNKMSVGDYTQAYFKSIFTMDKTFLSINCNKMLIPCCFCELTTLSMNMLFTSHRQSIGVEMDFKKYTLTRLC